MVDISGVRRRLADVSSVDRVRTVALRRIPGLNEDAPKRNLILLIAYLELILSGWSFLQHAL
jgi:hypothetical protein